MKITQITPDGVILSTLATEAFQKMRQLENKNDPNRRSDLYGPYEAVWLERTGKLPPEYFEKDDPNPWKLLADEARRNILWQALSGCLDINTQWALVYIQLVMDKALNDDDFAKELAQVNKQFLHSLDHMHAGHNTQNHMKHHIGHIDCPGCSATAALLMIDPQIRARFEKELKNLSKLSPSDRMDILKQEGLDKYLNSTIQNEKNGKIILPDSV
tara:strand:- start:153685 stop:154329 length:645 start_codon:yes stop_codon:yes gene_type:complete